MNVAVHPKRNTLPCLLHSNDMEEMFRRKPHPLPSTYQFLSGYLRAARLALMGHSSVNDGPESQDGQWVFSHMDSPL